MTSTTISILIIIFLATLIRSTFGFGESLVAVPLLLLIISPEIAVPLSVLISVTIAAVVVVQDHKKIHFKSARRLILSALPGIPLGLLLLVYGNELLVKCTLGLLIILYAIYSLNGKGSTGLVSDNKIWLFICGFLSGVLGGAYGLNGPPLVIYGKMRNWTARHFRATLQAYFLPASIAGMLGYWHQGLWTTTVSHYYIITLPVVIPAIFLGRYLNHRLKGDAFFKYVYWGLIFTGIILLVQCFR